MVRILHILNALNNSGIESFIMNVYRNIDRSQIQFDFFLVGEKARYDDEVLALGGKIFRDENKGSQFKLIKKYKKNLRELSKLYDIVHIHAMSCKVFFIARYAHIFGIKNIIVHSHGCGHKGLPHKIMQVLLNKYTTQKLACSSIAGEAMFGKNNILQVKFVFNAIDIDRYSFKMQMRNEVRKELKIENTKAYICVSRFYKQKNHLFLLDIFNEIQQKQNAVLFLVGWGDMLSEIETKISNLGLSDKVIILGERSDVYRLLNGMDAFLLPSIFEGLPVVAVEAQVNGLPVVMSDTITKQVDMANICTYISLKKSPQQWASEILRLKYDYDRKKKAEELRVTGFNILVQAKEMSEFYLNL